MGYWVTNKEGQLGYQLNKRLWISWSRFTIETLKAMLAEKVITNLDYLTAMKDAKK